MRRNMTIRRKLLLVFIPLVVLPMLLVGILIQIMLDGYIHSLISEKLDYTNLKIVENYERLIRKYDEYSVRIISHPSIQASLAVDELDYNTKLEIEQYISLYVTQDIENVLYITNNQEVISTNNAYIESKDAIINSKPYTNLEVNYGEITINYDQSKIYSDADLFIVARNVRYLQYERLPGKLLIAINLNAIEELFTREDLVPNSTYMLVDNNNQIVYHSKDEKIIGLSYLDYIKKQDLDGARIKIDGERVIYSAYDELQSEWKIISFISEREAFKKYYQYLKISLLIFTFILFLAVGIVLYFSYRLTYPIIRLSEAMTKFDNGVFVERINIIGTDEIATAGKSFNNMADEIEDLLKMIVQEEKRNKELEIKSLIYQINPHFLYNTLDNIYMLSRLSKEEKIAELIHSLSNFLRITLNKGISYISIDEEINHAKAYLDIQKIRYDNLFEYRFECDEILKNKIIIKFILQPLLENSIEHGFKGIEYKGMILIKAQKKDEQLIFSVEDNGRGFNSNILLKLEEIKNNPMRFFDDMKSNGYALPNIIARLKLEYEGKVDVIAYNNKEGAYIAIVIDSFFK